MTICTIQSFMTRLCRVCLLNTQGYLAVHWHNKDRPEWGRVLGTCHLFAWKNSSIMSFNIFKFIFSHVQPLYFPLYTKLQCKTPGMAFSELWMMFFDSLCLRRSWCRDGLVAFSPLSVTCCITVGRYAAWRLPPLTESGTFYRINALLHKWFKDLNNPH